MKLKLTKLAVPLVILAGLSWLIFAPPRRMGYAPKQPIPYSHATHVGKLGMDCQYCHSGVTQSRKAGIPSVSTCYNCHSVVKSDSPEIQKIWATLEGKSFEVEGKKVKQVEWLRVHNLPDHVQFTHMPHLKALMKEGQPTKVACAVCHGNVDQMEIVEQVTPMNMGWCVNCHRDYRDDQRYKDHGVSVDCNVCHQ